MDNKNRTLWVGNLSEEVTEELLYELFVQTGPIEQIKRPKDRESGRLRNYAFVTYKHEVSVPYTMFVMDGVSLFKRRLQIRNATGSDQGRSKTQATNDSYGLGLLPHPSFGKGVLPADLSEFCVEEPRRRHHHNDSRSPMSGVPGMMPMGYPSPGMHPMMGMPMGLMPPMNRSQTWHGSVDNTRRDGRRDEYRNERSRSRHDERDRSPHQRDGRRDSRDNGRDDRRRSSHHGHHQDVVNAQLQQLAAQQMQMLQQQGRHHYGSPSQGNRSNQRRY